MSDPGQTGSPPSGGMRVSRTVDPKNIPQSEQWAEQAKQREQDHVADAMRQGQAQVNGIPPTSAEDSMVIQLPDNQIVELGPPPIAIGFMVARIIADAGVKDVTSLYTAQTYLRALMYVRRVNGQQVPRPTTFAEAQALSNSFGDVGMEHVALAVAQEWPLPSEKELHILRKPLTTRSSLTA